MYIYLTPLYACTCIKHTLLTHTCQAKVVHGFRRYGSVVYLGMSLIQNGGSYLILDYLDSFMNEFWMISMYIWWYVYSIFHSYILVVPLAVVLSKRSNWQGFAWRSTSESLRCFQKVYTFTVEQHCNSSDHFSPKLVIFLF